MAEYLTETAYQRWLRQYQTNLAVYTDTLDQLRIQLDALHYEDEAEGQKITKLVNEIDENLDKAIPRNFSVNQKPLVGFEMFLENVKVLINLIYRVRGKNDRFSGIYQLEKERVFTIHQEFKFKEKLKQARELLEVVEKKNEVLVA
jgi:hypothetical protein